MTSDRSITTEPTVNKNLTAEGSALDIADRIRSLSIGSDASSFSVISRTSRANSFDSVRSLNSNQSHEDEDFPANPRPQSHADTSDSIDLQHSVLSLNTVKSLEELSGGVEILDDDRSNLEDIATDDSDAESEEFSGESHENPAWDEFTNFVHRPSASFKSEFERLARIKGWTGRTKRQYLVELLSTEVEFFWDLEDTDKLEHYQFLCQEMGIKQMPLTITQARNVSTLVLGFRKSTLLITCRLFDPSKSTFTASSTTCATRRSKSSHTRQCASLYRASTSMERFRGNALRLVEATWPLCCPGCSYHDHLGLAWVSGYVHGYLKLGNSWHIRI
jgi:hypothetical protein